MIRNLRPARSLLSLGPGMLFLFAAIFWGLPAHGAGSLSFDLPGALRYALDHAPSLDSARKQDASSALAVKNTIAGILPSLDFSTTGGLQGNNPVPVPGAGPLTSQAQIALTENLYDNGTTLINHSLAVVSQEVAHLTEDKTRDQVALNVIQGFYNLSLLTELLKTKEQQHDLYKEQYDRVANQYRQGFSTRQDFLRFKTQVQSAEIDLRDAHAQLEQAEAQLRRDISGVGGAEVAGATFVSLPIAAVIEGVPGAPASIAHTYDYRIAEAQKETNRLNVELAVRKYWPQLNLSASATQSAFNNSPGETGTSGSLLSWNALAQVQFNLWDWGTRRRNVEVAQLGADSSNDQLADGVLETQRLIESLAAEMAELDSTYKLSSELLKLSQESFDLLDQQYRLGQATYLDVSTSLTDLLNAKTRFYTTHFNLLRDLAQYRFYDGTLYDFVSKQLRAQ